MVVVVGRGEEGWGGAGIGEVQGELRPDISRANQL